jgi:hypothetical protein
LLSFFKSNNPGVVIFYIIYLILFRLCYAFVPVDTAFVFQNREPLSYAVFGLLRFFPGHEGIISLVLSGVLCFCQALLINSLINENKILSRKNYLGGLLFIIIASFFKESLVLSPAALALTCIIIATQKLFSLIRKEKAFGDIFDVGFLVALAVLFYFPSVVFILFALIGLATMRPFVYKEWGIIFSGFISPLILLFTYYFWQNKTSGMLPDMANFHHQGLMKGLVLTPSNLMLGISLFLLIFSSLAFLPGALFSSLIQVRKYSTILVLLIFLTVCGFMLQQTVSFSHWVLLALPVSVIFSMVLMQIKRNVIAEVIHLILLLLVLVGQYMPLFN